MRGVNGRNVDPLVSTLEILDGRLNPLTLYYLAIASSHIEGSSFVLTASGSTPGIVVVSSPLTPIAHFEYERKSRLLIPSPLIISLYI